MVLVLFESSLGFCLFKLSSKGKLDDPNLYKSFDDEESASNLVKLQSIHRFSSTADAVSDLSAVSEGKLSKGLKKFLVEEIQEKASKEKNETLIVSDPKLGGAISKKLSLNILSDSTTQDLFRGIRSQLSHLLSELDVDDKTLNTFSLGLSHSLSRFKLKFSADKIDTMIVQAIALLDDLDKEINIYAMRVKEWYGWHFPEMAKIINDNLAYSKIVKAMGFRTNAPKTDFSEILPEDLEAHLKSAAQISMGTEISESDLLHINSLADQVISITTYRAQLYEYLKNRMAAIAPNLTALVGELVGARLISHSGSLLQLAKSPASTIQILGAEKALFRAMKSKHDTPKYGLLFHASLVGQAAPKLKGKMARMLATKAALSIRYDALSDNNTRSDTDPPTLGIECRTKLEARLRQLESRAGLKSYKSSNGEDKSKQQSRFTLTGTGASYNPAADSLIPTGVDDEARTNGHGKKTEKESKKSKKEKRKAEDSDVEETPVVEVTEAADDDEEREKRKEEKRKRKEEKKLSKKRKADDVDGDETEANGDTSLLEVPQATNEEESSKKKKKKRKSEVSS